MDKLRIKRSLYDLLEVVRRGKWIIAAVFVIVLGTMAFITFTSPPFYQAESLLLINLRSTFDNEALSSGFIEPVDARDLSNQQLVLEQSLNIAEQTVRRLRTLETIPGTNTPLPLVEMGRSLPDAELARLLQDEYIRIAPMQRTTAFNISAVSTAPGEAALIANIYAEEFVQSSREGSRQRITGSRLFLEEQLARRKEELHQVEEQIKQFRSDRRAFAVEQESNYLTEQLAQLSSVLDEAQIDQSMKGASLRALQTEMAEIEPELSRHLASGVKAEIDRAQAEIADLELLNEQIYAENPGLRSSPVPDERLRERNARISHLRTRLEGLSKQYVEETLAVGGGTSSEERISYVGQLKQRIAAETIAYSSATAKVNAIERRMDTYRQRLENVPAQALELMQLERTHKFAEELYVQLEQKLQEVKFAEESEIGFARIIRPAFVPMLPVSPNKTKNLSIGVVLGLMLGFVAAFARAGIDTRIHTPEDLYASGLAVLGTIPDLRKSIQDEFGGRETVSVNGRDISTALVPLLNPVAPPSQAYRECTLTLRHRRRASDVQTLLVTSSEAGAGKSSTALNLATTLAQRNRRVLVVDADVYHSSIPKYLGLSEYADLEEVLQTPEAIDCERLGTWVENLYVIAPKKTAANPALLIGSQQMRQMLETAKKDFDVIIIDAPPVLASAETLELATQADTVILVALAGETLREAFMQSVENIRGAGGSILGVVLNKFDSSKVLGYKHTYGYKHEYYARYHDDSSITNERKDGFPTLLKTNGRWSASRYAPTTLLRNLYQSKQERPYNEADTP